jgi:hypothetical protein
MSEQLPTYRVEVLFSGHAPMRQLARASGVTDVDGQGDVVRCRVHGSFQPFLEALCGYEVLRLESVLLLDDTSTSGVEDRNAGTV